MKALVLGVGRMGTAIIWAMKQLGYDIIAVDSNKHAESLLKTYIRGFDFRRVVYFENELEYLFQGNPDIVISSLPYHQTELAAKFCVNNNIRYCDLGGRVDVSKNINDYAKENAKKPVFTDLGLAPGLINILAEEGYRELSKFGHVDSVQMMVGGLPNYLESNNNPLRYGVTWSVDGLINEYKDDCVILENGEIKVVKGMDGLEAVSSESLGNLEAFYTSGGASHTIESMRKKKVKNCSYKTLRYVGHRDLIKFLIRDCNLDHKSLTKIFDSCGKVIKDEVLVLAAVVQGELVWKKEILIKSEQGFSAMQRATAFSISSAASLMAQGKLDETGKKALTYEDVPFKDFSSNLKSLGIDLDVLTT